MISYLENNQRKRKIISVSKKRQITIPQKFFEVLDLGNEVECVLQEDSILIRPISVNMADEYSDFILSELVEQGYGGQELIIKFKEKRKKIKSALENLLKEADDIAAGKKKGATMEEVFGQVDE